LIPRSWLDHTSSYAAIVGGGRGLTPGEVTRADDDATSLDGGIAATMEQASVEVRVTGGGSGAPSRGRVNLRVAESDADLEAWRRVRIAVLPNERCETVEWMRRSMTPERVYLVADLEGVLAGSGLGGRSDLGYAGLHPRVLPWARRRGVGTSILLELAERAVRLGFEEAGTNVDDAGSLTFAERFGYREVDRQIEMVREVGAEPPAISPDGLEIVPVAERPELWREAYDPLALQAFEDMALDRPVLASFEQWQRDWLSWPEATFLAIADGRIVGCAGLQHDADLPERAENALTAVLRGWRGRGIASALKRRTLAFAAANGIREVYDWTQQGNAEMRRLNQHLGYVERAVSISVRARLPLNMRQQGRSSVR
jgi:mycothiol synthase